MAFTNRANSSLVTSVASIQNPSTWTRCTGSASRVTPGSAHSASLSTVLPIENSPPGIHTIPAGAGPGAAAVFAIVGVKAGDAVAELDDEEDEAG